MRLVQPGIGEEIWERVRERVGGMEATGRFRGEEMMRGEEREGLEKVIWSGGDEAVGEVEGCEVVLEAGEGLFIPKGWWHAVKGVGKGVSASVSSAFSDSVNEVLNRVAGQLVVSVKRFVSNESARSRSRFAFLKGKAEPG